ncbi:MAG TPA: IS200/IS605 family transposase [Candidatus Angelobacter sp.]
MPHTYVQNYLHIVFSTKGRKKFITKKFQPKLWSYMAGIGRNNDFLVLANGGMEDHAHLLIHLPASLALAKAVQLLKGSSSRWINENGGEFAWQEGYGAFSVSASNVDTVKRYIANQESHHRKTTFEQEFIAFLKKHKIDYDPKYVFD